MGYIFLILSVFTNAAKGYSSKRISNDVQTISENIYVNIIRISICCLVSGAGVLAGAGAPALKPNIAEIAICGISGLAMTVFLMSWIFAIKTGAYMLVSASASASFIVPIFFGVFLLQEQFTAFKALSVLIICAALVFLLRYSTSIKAKLTKMQLLLLAMVLISQGINQSMQKLYTHYVPDKDVIIYNFYTFLFTLLFLLIFKLMRRSKDNQHIRMRKPVYVYIAVMALALFGTSYFQSLAAVSIDAIILYPLANALSLVAGSTMACVFFKEKMKRDGVIGIVLTLVALIFSRM